MKRDSSVCISQKTACSGTHRTGRIDARWHEGRPRGVHAHGVKHIVIGGPAVSANDGHVRPSKDLDIVPDRARENLTRLASALAAAGTRDAEANDFDDSEMPMSALRIDDLAQGRNFRLHTDPGDLDLFGWVEWAGPAQFQECAPRDESAVMR
jgi:hypothetical protein